MQVVIPVRDKLEYTRTLVGQLTEQGGFTDLLIYDHASSARDMVEWLERQPDVTRVSEGLGVHEMWNLGIAEAVRRHAGNVDVLFLNNDVRLGPEFCRLMSVALHSDPHLVAVSGNYDGRQGEGVIPVRGIFRGRNDGSGGLAGFAFAVKAEFLGSYRFPEDMKWWFGDNDLCLSIEQAGGWYGVAVDATCEHLDGGSVTFRERRAELADQIEADRAAFVAKWPRSPVARIRRRLHRFRRS